MPGFPGFAARTLVVGADYRTCPLAVRDSLFVGVDAMPGFLAELRRAGVGQALVISTADRTAVPAVHDDPDQARRSITEVMAAHARVTAADLADHLYALTGVEAVRHIFRVTASLDGLVVGEAHVLSQIRDSQRIAREAGMAGDELDSILQTAYTVAERIRAETGIAERPVSIAAAAVELARGLHGNLSSCTALLIGTGDIGGLIGESLLDAGLGHLRVTHPVAIRAEGLAKALGSHVANFDTLARDLAEADIIVALLGTRQVLITDEMVRAALKARRNRPIFVIDAAIPGDVDPAVDRLDDAFLYTLDDLERVALEGCAFREREAEAARRIVEDALDAFVCDRDEPAAERVLAALRRYLEAEGRSALSECGGDADKATRLMRDRLIDRVSRSLRSAVAGGAGSGEREALERAVARIFGLADRREEDDG